MINRPDNDPNLLQSLWEDMRRFVSRRESVPYVAQMSATECGIACLTMVLKYYDCDVSLSDVRKHFDLGRDGVNILHLSQVARHYGLRTKAYSGEPKSLQQLPEPYIVHWKFHHYLVVEEWTDDFIYAVDPAQGRVRFTHEEFSQGFTGVVLALVPGVDFDPELAAQDGDKHHPWRTYVKQFFRLKGVRPFIFQVLAASFFIQIVGLILPLFTKILVDSVLPYNLTNLMFAIGIGLILFAVMHLLISYLRSALVLYLQARLDIHMVVGFLEHLYSLPFRFFQTHTSGDLIARTSSNSVIREVLTSHMISVILDGTFVFGYLIILLTQQPLFALIVVAVGLVQMILLVATTRKLHRLTQQDLNAQAETQAYLVETLKGIETLKAFGTEDRALSHWTDLFYKQLNINLKRNHLTALNSVLLGMFRTFSPLLLLWTGGMLVLNGQMTLGTMLALNALAAAFLAPVSTLAGTGQQLQVVGGYLDRITDVLLAPREQTARHEKKAAGDLSGHIQVKNMSFRYNENSPYVLKNIDFQVKPGQRVAIVGPTGSGKSTLIKLLLGFYSPNEGDVLYDDTSLWQYDLTTVRQKMGVVLQDLFLFSGSIRENISFKDPESSMDDIMQVAQLAQIHQEISKMPMAYETLLGEGGIGLSGGQKQRIALARALLTSPQLLILDEATSHLDNVTEDQIEKRLQALACAQVVVAHRLSTIQKADIILVMNEGEIVARGTHDELLESSSYYQDLYLTNDDDETTDDILDTGSSDPTVSQPVRDPA